MTQLDDIRCRGSVQQLPEWSQRYLSLLECQRIATLRRDGLGMREIASQLGRGP
uniref:helix-turn-helix domain-containing protein n=1 Tax=Asanoa ferruginea TaxID=53367 RepID=UPI000E27BC25|nr:helix-turn-helix domain-containing protein [Asanoa ferruginea]